MGLKSVPLALLPLLMAVAFVTAGGAAAPGSPAVPPAAVQGTSVRPWLTLPKAAEHRYRIKARIRLLLFWISKDNVGSARMCWYRGPGGDFGYEMLIGSDPARAPRKVNRWGYIAEERRGGTAAIVGVMKPSTEASIEEAESRLKEEQDGAVAFNMIRETVGGGESVARVIKARVSRDFSFRELDALLGEFDKVKTQPVVTRTRVDTDVTPGLLTTIAGLIHEDAEARRSQPKSRGAQGRVARYAFNAKTYTLTLASSNYLGTQQHEGRYYPNLVENDFEITMKGFSWKEKFTVIYAADGHGGELPVFASYQPRWWFKAEVLLDESQVF